MQDGPAGDRSTSASDHNEDCRLFAAGFNAHGQISANIAEDLTSFHEIQDIPKNDTRILFACWSSAVIISGNHVFGMGHRRFRQYLGDENPGMKCGVGDHDGMSACLDQKGRLNLVREQENAQSHHRIVCVTTDDSPRLSHIARAGNGHVVITIAQARNGNLCHALEFKSMEAFIRWFEDPSGEGNHPDRHHMLPGRPRQLLANTGTFVLLTEGGEVYTWGDPRYQSLARPITGDNVTPASKPGVAEALGGLNIVKIACGGWIGAALSEDRSLYLWGATTPGTKETIKCLRDAGSDRVALVDLPAASDGSPPDICDVAVGDNHVAVITQDFQLFVAGENKNGQLGLACQEPFFEDWQNVAPLGVCRSVMCGPKQTFVVFSKLPPL